MSGPNYFVEYLKEDAHIIAASLSVAVGAIVSMPLGISIGLIPILAFLGLDVVGLTNIATSQRYRNYVDRRVGEQKIKETIAQLFNEVKQRGSQTYAGEISRTFNRLWMTIERLESVANDNTHSFTENDLYRVKAAAVQYLRLAVADLFIRQRMANFDEDTVNENIKRVERYMREAKDATEISRLQQSHSKYLQLLSSQKKISHQNVAVTAAMMSLPDQIEEIYQMALINRGEQGASHLSESLTKLRTIEEINLEMESEIGQDIPDSVEFSGKTMYNSGSFSNPSKKPSSIKTGA